MELKGFEEAKMRDARSASRIFGFEKIVEFLIGVYIVPSPNLFSK